MLIGAHVSIAGGFDSCIDRAVGIGANCLQTFASSPRSLKTSPIADEVIEKYLRKRHEHNIAMHVFHGVYLINLAHENVGFVKIAVESLVFYQQLAGRIEGMGTVFHVGSHKGKGLPAVLPQVAEAIVTVLSYTPPSVTLMLENAAGHAGTIGQTFEELGDIIAAVEARGGDTKKLGVCLDTQHAFASGYDVRTVGGIDKLLSDIDSTIGMERVLMIHANDSLTEHGSHHDRHANIGEGEIGLGGFKLLINHPQLSALPFILEVPGDKKSGPRSEDVAALRALYSPLPVA